MKLPRWLVIAMLTTSVLAVLAAAACWWVTWPERTVRDYVELLRDGRFVEAVQRIDPPLANDNIQWLLELESDEEIVESYRSLQWELNGPRRPLDLLCGHLRFRISSRLNGLTLVDAFTAQRGTIHAEGGEWIADEVTP